MAHSGRPCTPRRSCNTGGCDLSPQQWQSPSAQQWPSPHLPHHEAPSLTRICCRARGSRGTPHRTGADSPPGTGSGCSGRSHGGCTPSPGCSNSLLSTSCTGRRCPGSQTCTCTCHSRSARALWGETSLFMVLQGSGLPTEEGAAGSCPDNAACLLYPHVIQRYLPWYTEDGYGGRVKSGSWSLSASSGHILAWKKPLRWDWGCLSRRGFVRAA